ncbi:TIGR01244 family phosphatase [Alcaligenaceae bacterium]|nr:TIGR01244 family phosphatase [Alcaligenaceae bacterium]
MSVPVTLINDNFAVAPQLSAADMQAVADAGFKSVIINRPDFEEGPDQPSSVNVIKAAEQAGLRVTYQPVVSGRITAEDVQQFSSLLSEMPGPILAFCRSGGRCTQLYRSATGV